MGRVKLEINKISNHTSRQVTFSKRRNGFLKKAYELCVLSDIDLALIMISPSGRLVSFSGKKRIEDVVIRYLNLPEEEILSGLASPLRDRANVLENREALINTLNKLKREDETAISQTIETAMKNDEEIIPEIAQEINMLQEQLETAEEELSTFEPNPLDMTSLEELESFEQQIIKTLTCIRERKEYLLNNHASSSAYEPHLQEHTLSFENSVVSWLPDDGQSHAPLSNEFVPSTPERDTSSTGFYAMLQGTSSNLDPQSMMREYEIVYHPENENLSVAWQHSYSLPYQSPSHMETPQIFQPPVQHEEEEQRMGVMPSGQPRAFSPLQHEEEAECMGAMRQDHAVIFLPQLQQEQGMVSTQQCQAEIFSSLQDEKQSMKSKPQGQPEIFSPQHQEEDGQGMRELPQAQEVLHAPPFQHKEEEQRMGEMAQGQTQAIFPTTSACRRQARKVDMLQGQQ